MWPFFPQRMDPTNGISQIRRRTPVVVVTRIALVKDDDNNSALRDIVLLWWSKKVAPTTRTFGERGARARGKVPHDDVVFLKSHFVSSSSPMGKTKTLVLLKRVCSMLSSVVDVKKARRRKRRRSLSLSLFYSRRAISSRGLFLVLPRAPQRRKRHAKTEHRRE